MNVCAVAMPTTSYFVTAVMFVIIKLTSLCAVAMPTTCYFVSNLMFIIHLTSLCPGATPATCYYKFIIYLRHMGFATTCSDIVCTVCHAYPAALIFYLCTCCTSVYLWGLGYVVNCNGVYG